MRFRLGINYWPASQAMYWWRRFEPGEVRADFRRIAGAGFDAVRIFLLWEDFQPFPEDVSAKALVNLLRVADRAAENRLSLIVTLFTGHMSGVNWLPAWALLQEGGAARFRVVSEGAVVNRAPRNWYTDESVAKAQALLARKVAEALRQHPALWAYDLGNENSNCVVPPSRKSAIAWLESMAGALRSVDSKHPVTLGLHAEDLEEDRGLGPGEAARVCDFLSMHGYPMYLRWAAAADDERVLPFLGLVTRWLGGGRDVLLEEFGAPAAVPSPRNAAVPMLGPKDAAGFTRRALEALHRTGLLGAMLWCFADYDAALWPEPPLDQAVHERHFGLWSGDLSPKPALAEIRPFAGLARQAWPELPWVDIAPQEFYQDPPGNLRRLYGRFCEHYAGQTERCSA